MTTFKNNSRYAELVFSYLELAERADTPLTYADVLGCFQWNFKGGSLEEAAQATRIKPETSGTKYPSGLSGDLLLGGPDGAHYAALRHIVCHRMATGRLKNREVMARMGTFLALSMPHPPETGRPRVFSGLRSVYHLFGLIWEWAEKPHESKDFDLLERYTRELLVGSAGVSRLYMPDAEKARRKYWGLVSESRICGLLRAVVQMKDVIRTIGGLQASRNARAMGLLDKERWVGPTGDVKCSPPPDPDMRILGIPQTLGPLTLWAFHDCTLYGRGSVRYALGKCDVERLHQLLMSTASLLIGVCAQAVIGTPRQQKNSGLAIAVAQRNVDRVVFSSRLVPLGEEVLVCKGYRRAYTAFLGILAGKLCRAETEVLLREAEETTAPGVLKVQDMILDLRMLDAANALNVAKVFKICPAPDVSPGQAMMDRITQIGNGNEMKPAAVMPFTDELRSQILRALVRTRRVRLKLRRGVQAPVWYEGYRRGEVDRVPSSEIHQFLAWEGCLTMPEVSPYDPKNWKDSGVGADSLREAHQVPGLRYKGNMMTRLIYDDDCPMPGRPILNEEHVIKFFVKAEGHKDPARGIFSANLTDRQAQSWMERAVERVAINHPSFMIGQPVDVKDLRVAELTTRPVLVDVVALYYSFDISGWSAKMPGEPQRISHRIWAQLYGGHLFNRATEINEGAIIYMDLDGYEGWYRNTASNLEGFNGKEMTMVLIALLSLAVKRWRIAIVEAGVMEEFEAQAVSAMLFAYIDDGLSRIDLPKRVAMVAFEVYKETVIETFSMCGFSVEVSKCYPSDRFAIFLNEVYLAGRHVVHGVRAAMGISAEATERHTSLIERVTSVATGVRGAVMAGLNPVSGVFLMAYHVILHLREWVDERDPVILAVWSLCPRGWGGLGLPNIMQTFVSGSGSAFEEGVATMQSFAQSNRFAEVMYLNLMRAGLQERTHMSVLTAPLSARVEEGYMVDSRITGAVRTALRRLMEEGKLSTYATRLLKYADTTGFSEYAECIVPLGEREVVQEQMLDNASDAHPHTIFSSFAKRLEKSITVKSVLGYKLFGQIMKENRADARESIAVFRARSYEVPGPRYEMEE